MSWIVVRTTIRQVTLAALVLPIPFFPAGASAAAVKSCKPIVNPYEGTRYEGVNLSAIRATAVSCRTARRVARGAHRKSLSFTPPSSGIRRFTWRSWNVTGDLRGARDRYVATAGGNKRVTWRF